MRNQDYLHMLDLLKNEHQEKKWIKYAALSIFSIGSIALYYAIQTKKKNRVIEKMKVNGYILRAQLFNQEKVNKQYVNQLDENQKEIDSLKNEKSILLNKMQKAAES